MNKITCVLHVNVPAVQGMVDSSAQRLVSLANQWEKHRAPLIDQYRTLKEVSDDRAVSHSLHPHSKSALIFFRSGDEVPVVSFIRQSEAQQKLEEINELRERMKDVAAEAKGKEELYKQLVRATCCF